MAPLVFGVFARLVTSVAVTVRLPGVFIVIEKVCAPATSAVLVGCVALASVEVRPTASVAVGTRYQFESTAYTVTLNGVPAVCAVGDPDLPLTLPGEKASPGSSASSFANA